MREGLLSPVVVRACVGYQRKPDKTPRTYGSTRVWVPKFALQFQLNERDAMYRHLVQKAHDGSFGVEVDQ